MRSHYLSANQESCAPSTLSPPGAPLLVNFTVSPPGGCSPNPERRTRRMEQGPNFSLSPCLQPRASMQCTIFVMAPGS